MRSGTPDLFIAVSSFLLKAREKKAVFANAGQPPFMIVSEGRVEKISVPEIAIGVEEDTVYSETEYDLKSGVIVVMCTDGVYPAGKADSGLDIAGFEKVLAEACPGKNNFNKSVLDIVLKDEKKIYEDDSTLLSVMIE